ncbi:MAG: phage Gp37/Gp68 family protein [Mediterranea sp.]|jgi:protein gp37|nr:phage Gp37/Gp68 family protein [Mediterranea sp.]
MRTTKIEWTERTWNPVTGCTKYSAGCEHCYAETMSRRLQAMGNQKYTDGFKPTIHEDALIEPYSWKKPNRIFVCSMSDLFHKDIPVKFIDKVFHTIEETPWHTYQILTKRSGRMANYFKTHEIPSNAWLGTTVEDTKSISRIEDIRSLKASIKFLSCEPLLEDLGILNLEGIDWVIVGGESGVAARPMKEEWVINIKKQVDNKEIPFFFKQWGTWGQDGVRRNKKLNGKLIDGKIYQEMPYIYGK